VFGILSLIGTLVREDDLGGAVCMKSTDMHGSSSSMLRVREASSQQMTPFLQSNVLHFAQINEDQE